MADEPTLGEIGRGLDAVRRAMEQLAGKVLTVEVWKAERESLELRIRENEKDIATLEAKASAEREKREREKAEADIRAAAQRRQVLFAIFTAVVAPILVTIATVMLKGGS